MNDEQKAEGLVEGDGPGQVVGGEGYLVEVHRWLWWGRSLIYGEYLRYQIADASANFSTFIRIGTVVSGRVKTVEFRHGGFVPKLVVRLDDAGVLIQVSVVRCFRGGIQINDRSFGAGGNEERFYQFSQVSVRYTSIVGYCLSAFA